MDVSPVDIKRVGWKGFELTFTSKKFGFISVEGGFRDFPCRCYEYLYIDT